MNGIYKRLRPVTSMDSVEGIYAREGTICCPIRSKYQVARNFLLSQLDTLLQALQNGPDFRVLADASEGTSVTSVTLPQVISLNFLRNTKMNAYNNASKGSFSFFPPIFLRYYCPLVVNIYRAGFTAARLKIRALVLGLRDHSLPMRGVEHGTHLRLCKAEGECDAEDVVSLGTFRHSFSVRKQV